MQLWAIASGSENAAAFQPLPKQSRCCSSLSSLHDPCSSYIRIYIYISINILYWCPDMQCPPCTYRLHTSCMLHILFTLYAHSESNHHTCCRSSSPCVHIQIPNIMHAVGLLHPPIAVPAFDYSPWRAPARGHRLPLRLRRPDLPLPLLLHPHDVDQWRRGLHRHVRSGPSCRGGWCVALPLLLMHSTDCMLHLTLSV